MADALAALGFSEATSYSSLSLSLSLSTTVCVCVCLCEAAEVTKYENDCASGSAVVACHMCAMYIELPQDGAAREASSGDREGAGRQLR